MSISPATSQSPYADIRPYTGDTHALRQVFGAFPSGVAALSANVGGTPTVLVVSSFAVGISLEPPLASFAVQRSSTTWPDLAKASTIGVSILGQDHSTACRQLASRDKSVRFKDVDYVETPLGSILFERASIWMECVIEHRYPAGDHEIIVLRVLGLVHHEDHHPLVMHRSQFRSLA